MLKDKSCLQLGQIMTCILESTFQLYIYDANKDKVDW